MKGKAAVEDSAFSNPASARETPAGTPGPATPAASTPAGSGDEAAAGETIDGATEELNFKAAKGRKKLTRKQLKEREDRRRARTLAFLSSSLEGAVREPDTESDEENEIHKGQKLRIPSKKSKSCVCSFSCHFHPVLTRFCLLFSGTSTPTLGGIRK